MRHPLWFTKQLSNAVILITENGVVHIDLADFPIKSLEDWLNEESVKHVTRLSYETMPTFEQIKRPKIVAYTNGETHFGYMQLLRRFALTNE